jgi:hypothetical protein
MNATALRCETGKHIRHEKRLQKQALSEQAGRLCEDENKECSDSSSERHFFRFA